MNIFYNFLNKVVKKDGTEYGLDCRGQKIINVPEPSGDDDLVTKKYVDERVGGGWTAVTNITGAGAIINDNGEAISGTSTWNKVYRKGNLIYLESGLQDEDSISYAGVECTFGGAGIDLTKKYLVKALLFRGVNSGLQNIDYRLYTPSYVYIYDNQFYSVKQYGVDMLQVLLPAVTDSSGVSTVDQGSGGCSVILILEEIDMPA